MFPKVDVNTVLITILMGLLTWLGGNMMSDVNTLKLDMIEIKTYMNIYHSSIASDGKTQQGG